MLPVTFNCKCSCHPFYQPCAPNLLPLQRCSMVLWSYGPSVSIQQRANTTCGNFYSLHSIEARTQSIPLFAFYASGDSFFCFWYLHKPSLLGRMEAKPKVPFINNYRSRCPRMEGMWFKPRMGSEPVVHVHTRSLDGA